MDQKQDYTNMPGINDFEDLEIWKMARQLLNISKGSAGEVKNMHYIAEDQNYISEEALLRRDRSQQLINGISRLMKYLKTSNL
jgi:four helix bundle protein